MGEGPEALRVGQVLESQRWRCTRTRSVSETLRIVRDDPALDMVVLVPGRSLESSSELCRAIKFDRRTRFTWVVFLLTPQHNDHGDVVLEAGADDCVRTIANDRELLMRLMKARRMKQATDSLEDAEMVITALANAVEGKDSYTCGHVERVGAYSVAIGRRLGLGEPDLLALKQGGIVHDIGKVGIPDHVLNKPGKLTDEELAIMRRHPLIGYDILKPLRTFHNVLPIVRWHHEKLNGRGYPDGISGEQIPILARIAAVADVFDALATDRPYRNAFPMDKCRQILVQSAVDGELDPELVKVMLEITDGKSMSAAA
jgi:putative two-component system response regulator